MKMRQTALVATTLAGFYLSTTAAHAIVIDIGASFNGGPVLEIAGPSANTNPVDFGTPVGGVPVGFFTVNAHGVASSTSLANSFGSTSLDVAQNGTATGSLTVYLTASNITGPIGALPFSSAFTSNTLPAGWTVAESTYLSTTDGTLANGLGTLLGTFTFSSIGSAPPVLHVANTGSGPYSLTEVYTLTSSGCTPTNGPSGICSALSTIDLSGASPVPAPIVGAGIPGLMAACGGLLALAIRRRRQRA